MFSPSGQRVGAPIVTRFARVDAANMNYRKKEANCDAPLSPSTRPDLKQGLSGSFSKVDNDDGHGAVMN